MNVNLTLRLVKLWWAASSKDERKTSTPFYATKSFVAAYKVYYSRMEQKEEKEKEKKKVCFSWTLCLGGGKDEEANLDCYKSCLRFTSSPSMGGDITVTNIFSNITLALLDYGTIWSSICPVFCPRKQDTEKFPFMF